MTEFNTPEARMAEIVRRGYLEPDVPRIIVTGNPVDGFKFYGPIDADTADELGSSDDLDSLQPGESWWFAPLEPFEIL